MVDKQANASPPEHSDVVIFPPVIPLTGFLLGVLLEAMWPTASWIPTRSGPACARSARFSCVLAAQDLAGWWPP